MRRRNDGAGGSLREEFGDVCFHALGIIDQNREYLQMHLLASADLPTRQALSDIQIESARLDRTVRNAITLYQLEMKSWASCSLWTCAVCWKKRAVWPRTSSGHWK